MNKIKVDRIIGSRRLSNYCWSTIILLGGFNFFLVGFTSYLELRFKIISVLHNENILFLPQGAVMTFYGMTGILISLFLWYTVILDVGSGYNEFNNQTGVITIFRFGFPGKNRLLKLQYRTKDISAVKINIKEGLSPKREICLVTKDKRQIPLTKVGEPLSLQDIEKQAKEIAIFLNIKLEGIA